jgi:hypothetical protein
MKNPVIRGLAAVSLSLVLVAAGVATEQTPDSPKPNPAGTCAEFMQSDKAPQEMANMMEMARRMGDGDAMVDMTRMMEMMGSMGERMGGQGGMTQPGGVHPGK